MTEWIWLVWTIIVWPIAAILWLAELSFFGIAAF